MKIFLTVGTHSQQFDRLVKAMDAIAKQKKAIQIFGQIGNSSCEPRNFQFQRFVQEPEYTKKFEEANVIVSHGGAGAIIHAMQAKKKMIIVPRLKKFGEHSNDHQNDLSELLHKHKKALAVNDTKDLEKALREIEKFKPDFDSTRNKLIAGLEKWLASLH